MTDPKPPAAPRQPEGPQMREALEAIAQDLHVKLWALASTWDLAQKAPSGVGSRCANELRQALEDHKRFLAQPKTEQSPAAAAASESNAPTAPAVTAARPTPAGSPNPASAAAASLEVEALAGEWERDAAAVQDATTAEVLRKCVTRLRAVLRRGGRHE